MNQVGGDRQPCGSFILSLEGCWKLEIENGMVLLFLILYFSSFFLRIMQVGEWAHEHVCTSQDRFTSCFGGGTKLAEAKLG